MKTRLPEHGPLETPRFWRTLEERIETPEAQAAAHDEFLPGAGPGAFDDVHGLPVQSGFSRRDFLGLVSATAALAARINGRVRSAVPKPTLEIIGLGPSK